MLRINALRLNFRMRIIWDKRFLISKSPQANPLAKRTGCRTFAAMKTISVTSARADLYRVIDLTLEDHEPVQITGKRGNAVLLAESDWRAIQETLYLLSVPGMRELIREGMAEPVEECSREIDL